MRACPCLRGVWANADLDGYRRKLSGFVPAPLAIAVRLLLWWLHHKLNLSFNLNSVSRGTPLNLYFNLAFQYFLSKLVAQSSVRPLFFSPLRNHIRRLAKYPRIS